MRTLLLLLLATWQPQAFTQDLHVITWNIRHANEVDGPDAWEFRRDHVAGVAASGRFAIIALQEAMIGQLRFLDGYLPRHTRFGVGREDGAERGEFCAVYVDTTVLEPLEVRTRWLAPEGERPGKGWDAACERVVTKVRLRLRSTGDTLTVLNTHWDHEGHEARTQSARIIEDLVLSEHALGRRVLVMGDLNATPDDPAVQRLHSVLADACPRHLDGTGTFNAFGTATEPYRRIDHILHSIDRWVPMDYAVMQQPMPEGRFPSDHFPVSARLRTR